MNCSRLVWPVLALTLIPSAASANAGTPLMWASMLHLLFGNAIIGVIEGLLFIHFFKPSSGRPVWIFILANYVSAWAGTFLNPLMVSFPDLTIANVQSWLPVFLAAAFVITLVLEFPFVLFALRSREHRFRQAVTATILVNGVSYLLLFGWYWMASRTSMISELQVVPAQELAPAPGYELYYLAPDGGQVLKLPLIQPQRDEVLSAVSAPHRNDRLLARKRDDSGLELFVRLDSEQKQNVIEKAVSVLGSGQTPVEWPEQQGGTRETRGTWFNYGTVPSFDRFSDWEFRTGLWPGMGISGKNRKTKESVEFSMETPYASWIVRNATQLKGDFVVFQLGNDQICILHPVSKKISLLARGKGPVVVDSALPRQ